MIKKNNKYKNQLNLEIYKLKVNKYQAEAWIYPIYPVKFMSFLCLGFQNELMLLKKKLPLQIHVQNIFVLCLRDSNWLKLNSAKLYFHMVPQDDAASQYHLYLNRQKNKWWCGKTLPPVGKTFS